MNIGGPAHHVSLLSGRLNRSRYRTVLLTGALGEGEGSFVDLASHYGVKPRVVPGLRPQIAPLNDLRALIYIIRTIKQLRPRIVHTHTAKAGALGRLAAILSPGSRPVIVHTYHGHVLKGYFGRGSSALFRLVERALARKSDCLIGVSQATVNELVELGVAKESKFRVIPIGLELERLLAVDRSAGDSFRAEAGAAPGDVLAVFLGRLAPIKRVDVLIDAFSLAAERESHLRLAVVGDGELRQTLEGHASRAGVGHLVTFLGFREDLDAIAAGSDVAVLSSDNEGTPVALIEAAAAARPAIATAVGGVPDIVTDATGILVPQGDAPAMADALVRLARDAERRQRMGQAARVHVRERFSAARLIRDIDALYRELLTPAMSASMRGDGHQRQLDTVDK